MNTFKKLVSLEDKFISVGSYIKFTGIRPYEEETFFLVYQPNDSKRGLGLIVATGYKSGLILVVLPIESDFNGGGAIDRDWLISNWSKWVYPDCKVEDVYICKQVTHI